MANPQQGAPQQQMVSPFSGMVRGQSVSLDCGWTLRFSFTMFCDVSFCCKMRREEMREEMRRDEKI